MNEFPWKINILKHIMLLPNVLLLLTLVCCNRTRKQSNLLNH